MAEQTRVLAVLSCVIVGQESKLVDLLNKVTFYFMEYDTTAAE